MPTIGTVQARLSASSSVVNGIDTDAVHELIDSVDDNPAKGMTHWRVASAWQGGTHSRAQVDGFAIDGVDVPRRFCDRHRRTFELGVAMPLPTRRSISRRHSMPA